MHTHTHTHTQGKYFECAEVILCYFPEAMDHMIHLVYDEGFPEANILSAMEYLCNSSVAHLVNIIPRLADRTSMAGMELLRFVCVCVFVCMCMYVRWSVSSPQSFINNHSLSVKHIACTMDLM